MKNNKLNINFLGNYGPDYSYCRYMARAGHKSLFFTDLKIHPRLSIAYYHNSIQDDDVARIRIEDMLSTPHLSLNIHARDILKKVSNCDVLQCNGLYGMWGVLSGKPFIYKPFGGDINHWPFLDDTEEERIRGWYIRSILQEATILLGFLHQKKFNRVIDELELDRSRIRNWCFPMNADAYTPLPEKEWMDLRKDHSLGKFVIFNCAQLMMQPTREMQYTKGSDIMARGVKTFIDGIGDDKVKFWVIDRGPQKKEYKEFVAGIGLDKHIRWIEPQQREGFIRHLNAADVVLDQINPDIANYGYICVEAMSCAKPVFTYVDQNYREKIVGEPHLPNINVLTVEDIHNQLLHLYNHREDLKRAGEAGRKFVLDNHHWTKACERFAEIFNEAIVLHKNKMDRKTA